MEIPIHLAVEDSLSDAVVRSILRQSSKRFAIGTSYMRGGFSYLKKRIAGFNVAAKHAPFLVVTDLDAAICPVALIQDWLPVPKHHNLIFRVAVSEIEAWVLAHREAFGKFLRISSNLIPENVDAIPDPKRFLIDLALRSRYRRLRESLAPVPGSTAKTGPDYNGQLVAFVERSWRVKEAQTCSPSLKRTVDALATFTPIWQTMK